MRSVIGMRIQTWPARTLYWPSVTAGGGFDVADEKLEADGEDRPAEANDDQFRPLIRDRRVGKVQKRYEEDSEGQKERAQDVSGIVADSWNEDGFTESPIEDGDDCHEDPQP